MRTMRDKRLSYSELIKIPTYEGRLKYLQKDGAVGDITYGSNRWINQEFYRSKEWRSLRDKVIIRDNGCDLGVDGMFLDRRDIIIHHINEITEDDIINRTDKLMDMDNLVCTSKRTHNAIHYKTNKIPDPYKFKEREPNDQAPWKKV